MNPQELYNKLETQFKPRLHFLQDKPEETVDSTLKACWQYASGIPVSAEEAVKRPLPDLDDKQIKLLYDLLEQRAKNIPLAHITGRQNFFGIEFLSDKRALIPRKETEILAREALELSFDITKQKGIVQVMDICCGSGNLGLAVAYSNPSVRVYASDLSEEAVALANENMYLLNLQKQVKIEPGDLFSAFDKKEYYGNMDLIICNPPYITTTKVPKMGEEIAAHEPALAFDGGMFGLKIIQMLIEKAPVY